MRTKSFVVLATLLLLIAAAGCDKDNWRFTTRNRFDVNASAHQLEVRTSIYTRIQSVRIDGGVQKYVDSMPKVQSKSIHLPAEADSCYVYLGDTVKMVIGRWFSITGLDDCTHPISIAENNSGKDRTLVITLRGQVKAQDIVIHQRKK